MQNTESVGHEEDSQGEEELSFTSVSVVTAGYVFTLSQVGNDKGS